MAGVGVRSRVVTGLGFDDHDDDHDPPRPEFWPQAGSRHTQDLAKAPGMRVLPIEVMGMPTREVVLGLQQHELVDQLVASGRYKNASEAFRERLRLLERPDADADETASLSTLCAAADQGWADVAAGRYVDVNETGPDESIAEIGARTVADVRSPG